VIAHTAVVALAFAGCTEHREPPPPDPPHMAWGLVLHGGAGVITRAKLTPEHEAAIRADLERALRAAYAVLARGGSSTDAVPAAITILEDSPLFNAGKGAVFTHDGINELDAAIMNGRAHTAGAVAGVRTIKNPILLAKAVMDGGRYVMLAGSGAEAFAATAGIECRKDAEVIDETPGAYKPIDAVMHAQRDLVAIVHTLRQVICVKG